MFILSSWLKLEEIYGFEKGVDWRDMANSIAIEMATKACIRYQNLAVWATAHDQRNEEGHRRPRLHEGETSQQVGGSGVCFLGSGYIEEIKIWILY